MTGKWRRTELVRPLLVAAPAGRIVNVVSEYYSRKLDLGNLQGERKHSYFGAYSASELGKVSVHHRARAPHQRLRRDRRVGQPRSRQDKLQQTVGRDGPGAGVMQHTSMVKPADQAAGGISWAAVQQPDHLRRGDRLGQPCSERKPLSPHTG